jgi:chemotaxis protein MotB
MLNMDRPAPIMETVRTAAAPATAAPIARRAADEHLFDAGDSLIDDDTMRANWAVPWSDLMMTMFVLFAALLAAQTFHAREEKHKQKLVREAEAQQIVERDKIVKRDVPALDTPVESAPALPAALNPAPSPAPSAAPATAATAGDTGGVPGRINVLAESNEAANQSNLKDVEIALLDDQSVKVSVQGPMFFAPGKADLRPEVTQFLDRLAQIMRATPYDIRIVGHTDDRAIKTGMFPSNWELSLVRASRVARYLIDTGGIDPSRFSVVGRGEFDPVSTNTDEQSRAMNRRVEIIITRDIGKAKGANQQ